MVWLLMVACGQGMALLEPVPAGVPTGLQPSLNSVPVEVGEDLNTCGPEGVGLPEMNTDLEAWWDGERVVVWRNNLGTDSCFGTGVTAGREDGQIAIQYTHTEGMDCGPGCVVAVSFDLTDVPSGVWTITDGILETEVVVP